MISLAINPVTQNPAVSFFNVGTTSLDYSSFNGSIFSTTAVTASRDQGQYSSLTFDGSEPEILYYTPAYGGVDEAVPSGRIWSLTRITSGGVDLDQATNSDGDDTISWITSDGLQVMDI